MKIRVNESLYCEIVSVDGATFSGHSRYVAISGKEGELGIAPGHAPLITHIPPGHVRFFDLAGDEQVFYIEGGFLEVQPDGVTILADTVVRADHLNEAMAREAKAHAEAILRHGPGNFEYPRAAHELVQAMAKLQVIRRVNGSHPGHDAVANQRRHSRILGKHHRRHP